MGKTRVPCVTMVRCPMMCKGLTDNENYCQLYKDCIMSLIKNLEIINWQRKTDIFSRQYFVPETRIQGLQNLRLCTVIGQRPTKCVTGLTTSTLVATKETAGLRLFVVTRPISGASGLIPIPVVGGPTPKCKDNQLAAFERANKQRKGGDSEERTHRAASLCNQGRTTPGEANTVSLSQSLTHRKLRCLQAAYSCSFIYTTSPPLRPFLRTISFRRPKFSVSLHQLIKAPASCH